MKKILCIVLCIATVLSLSACGLLGGKSDDKEQAKNPTTDSTQTETPTEKPTEGTENLGGEYRENSTEWVAQQFVASLIKADYKAALRHFAVPAETPYFTETDVEWYLPRSKYADVMDVTYAEYTITVEKNNSTTDTASCVVTVADKASDKTQTFNLNLILDSKNKWGVKDNEFYLDEYYVVAPGGKATLTLDGQDAPTYDSKFGTSQNQYMYKFTYVGKSEKTLKVTHENFTDEEKVFPVENTAEEPYKIVAAYDDEAALTAIKDIWMEFNKAAVDKKAYSELIHLLSPNANTELAKSAMDGMTEMLSDGKCKEFVISKMTYAPMKEGQETKWLASDKLQVCFNYTLNWVYTGFGGGPEDMNSHEILILHYDGEKFTLDTIVQNRLFVQRDDWRNDYLD